MLLRLISNLKALRAAAFTFALLGCAGSAAAADAALEEKAAVCAACHGENGRPIDKLTPIIWGQMEGFIYLQLRDFKSGARKHEVMQAVVADLEKADLQALAAHFAAKPWPDLQQPSAPKAVADKAIAANVSVGCTGCHLGEYQGDSTVPRLAGQQRAYMDKTIKEFRDRTRGNNPGMSDLMNAAVPDDLAALAEYTAGLQIQGGDNSGSR
ncbi:MAG: cytochrome c4 [Hyphomicrobium sp.]